MYAINLYLKNATWHMDIVGEISEVDTGFSVAFSPESIIREFRRAGYGNEITITVKEPRLGAKYACFHGE